MMLPHLCCRCIANISSLENGGQKLMVSYFQGLVEEWVAKFIVKNMTVEGFNLAYAAVI